MKVGVASKRPGKIFAGRSSFHTSAHVPQPWVVGAGNQQAHLVEQIPCATDIYGVQPHHFGSVGKIGHTDDIVRRRQDDAANPGVARQAQILVMQHGVAELGNQEVVASRRKGRQREVAVICG